MRGGTVGHRPEGLSLGRRCRHRLEGEDDQPASRGRAHRGIRRSDGAGHQGGRGPQRALRGHFQQRRRVLDVPEPRAAYPRGRLYPALGREHLRQGPRHRARGRQGPQVPAAVDGGCPPDVPDGSGGRSWRRGRRRRRQDLPRHRATQGEVSGSER